MSFRQARIEELPQWSNGPQAQGYAGALGDAQDGELEDIKVATVERFPALCDPLAIDAVGGGYDLDRFDGEPRETYRRRVLQSWETHDKAGLAVAIIDSLHAYGLPDVQIYASKEHTT